MNPHPEMVISASRRTDIPAFYMPWFMDQIERGYFEVVNPYNQRVSVVPATPDKVHTIVFWSKNFQSFIAQGYGERLLKKGYRLFFNFTINSTDGLLEPHVPPLNERLGQLAYLAEHFGCRLISWRFDPICFFRIGQGPRQDNLKDFDKISKTAAAVGIERCITSFMDHYSKIRKRLLIHPGLAFVDPLLKDKVEALNAIERRLGPLNIHLATCCEKDVLAALPLDSSIKSSACIPGELLMELHGGQPTLKKDIGQRVKAGCGCSQSVDIGSYRQQPCYHNCLFCYANPASGAGVQRSV